MQKLTKVRPGFVRVMVQGRSKPKTIQIRAQRAANPEYMRRNGLILVPEPVNPIMPTPIAPVTPPPPSDPVNTTEATPTPTRRRRATNENQPTQ